MFVLILISKTIINLKVFIISSVDDTWVKIRDSIKASAKEKVGVLQTNRNKPWFDEECSELANKRKGD